MAGRFSAARKVSDEKRRAAVNNYNFGVDTTGFNRSQWDDYLYGFNPEQEARKAFDSLGISSIYQEDYQSLLAAANTERENRQNKYNLWYQEEYNSAKAKAAAEKEAGLNPDIVGIDQAPDMTSEGEVTPSEPVDPTVDLALTKSVIEIGSNLIGLAFNTGSSIMDMAAKGLALDNNELAIYQGLSDMLPDLAVSILGDSALSSGIRVDGPNGGFYAPEIAPELKVPGVSKRVASKINKQFASMYNNPNFRSKVQDILSDSKNSQARYDASNKEDFMSIMTDIYAADIKAKRSAFRASEKRNDFEFDYYGTASGTKAGEAYNGANDAAIGEKENAASNAKYLGTVLGEMNRLMDKYKDSPLGSIMISTLASTISGMLTQLQSNGIQLPAIAVSNMDNMSSWDRDGGYSKGRSRGFKFR